MLAASDTSARTRGVGPRVAAAALLPLALALVAASGARADDPPAAETFNVTNTQDEGEGSLREAIAAANANANRPAVDRIVFRAGLAGRITLQSPLDVITEPVRIVGSGAGLITVHGNGLGPIFRIETTPGDDVVIAGLRLIGGNAGAGGEGGAISSRHADLVVRGATISGNTAGLAGGGISSRLGSTDVATSTVSGNSATAATGQGGGIDADGPVTIANSTISGNTAMLAGGGVHAQLGAVEVRNSTVAFNEVTSGAGHGGGVAVLDDGSNPAPVLTSALVGKNSAAAGPDLAGLGPGAPEFGARFSLIESTAGATVNSLVLGSNIIGLDPRLEALAFNGGPTRTHALRLGSPAVDRGPLGAPIACPPVDQRGLDRDYGHRCDIGAYEQVRCGPVPVNRFSGPGGGTLTGTPGRDGFLVAGGSSLIYGYDGDDAICGGPGPDVVHAGGGADLVYGGGGADLLFGGPGNDRIFGGPGADRIDGGGGHDLLNGGAGPDTIRGGSGSDRIFGDLGNDTLYGGPGNDRIFGGPGADRIFGGPGRNRLHGGPGNDVLVGGRGRNRFVGGRGRDVCISRSRRDTFRGCQVIKRTWRRAGRRAGGR